MTDHQAAYTQTSDSRSTSPHRHSLSTPTPSTNYRLSRLFAPPPLRRRQCHEGDRPRSADDRRRDAEILTAPTCVILRPGRRSGQIAEALSLRSSRTVT